ncbi:MAG: MFS transporter [Defluviitaleaceae bacterium]|nr:MFS transporter [Defluviitaleaceae bacterium]
MKAFIILILPLATTLPYLAVAILMNDIMASLEIGYSLAGLSMTVMLFISGICMFAGSKVQGKIGIINTIVLAIWMTFLGSAICFIANNFIVFFIGRIISGIGFGLISVSLIPYISAWFKGNMRTYMITANLITNSIASIISLSIANPLKMLIGTWQGVFGVYSIFIVGVALLWMFFGKSNEELENAKKLYNTEKSNQESPLRKALKIKQYRLLMISGIFIMSAITAVTTFMPTFLINEKGFSLNFSVMAANINNATFILGALAGGVLLARSGKRKIIFQIGIICMMIGGLLLAYTGTYALVVIAVSMVGFGFMLRIPAQTTIMMETIEPLDPIILGGATAMISGTGQIISLAVPPLFSILSSTIGMSGAMQMFFWLLIISVIASFMISETGMKK